MQYISSFVLLLVLLVAVLWTLVESEQVPLTDKEICVTILNSTEHINAAQKTLTYQCRPGDNCGGAADRMSGIMSGVFFAMISERSFRIQWPGIDHVFAPQSIQWLFDENSYGIAPDQLKHSGFVTKTWGLGTVTTPFSNHTHVAIYNDLNTGEINLPKHWGHLAKYEHIFYHSNRDPVVSGLFQHVAQKYFWPTGDGDVLHNYYIAYRCVFNDIFTPSADFMTTPFKPLLKEEMPFHQLIAAVEDQDHVSLAFHFRIADKDLADDPVEARISDAEMAWLASFGREHSAESTKKMNLFFITNSVNSALKLINDPTMQDAYNMVFSQELTGSRHINYEDKSTTSHSLKQAMMDWYIMKQAHYLVCGRSGFCRVAGTVASEEQVKIDKVTKKVIPHSYKLITNRDARRP